MEDSSTHTLVNESGKVYDKDFLISNLNADVAKKETDLVKALKAKAREQVMYKTAVKYYTVGLQRQMDFASKDPEFLKMMSELEDMESEDSMGIKSSDVMWLWITVNPPDDIDFLTLKKKVEKLIKKKWIEQYAYCYEQRSEKPGEFHGFHAHILINKPRDKSTTHASREVRNTFKQICSDRSLDLKYLRLGQEVARYKYVHGSKDAVKGAKLNVDSEWRASLGIDDVYKNF